MLRNQSIDGFLFIVDAAIAIGLFSLAPFLYFAIGLCVLSVCFSVTKIITHGRVNQEYQTKRKEIGCNLVCGCPKLISFVSEGLSDPDSQRKYDVWEVKYYDDVEAPLPAFNVGFPVVSDPANSPTVAAATTTPTTTTATPVAQVVSVIPTTQSQQVVPIVSPDSVVP